MAVEFILGVLCLGLLVGLLTLWYKKTEEISELHFRCARLSIQKSHIENTKLIKLEAAKEDWTPEKLVERGWQRDWGHVAVMDPHFEILRRESKKPDGKTHHFEYLILCPTFLSKPIYIMSAQPIHLSY